MKSWDNFADLLDPVAFDKSLSDEFSPTGKIDDDIVINRDSLRLSGFNPHSATGYLATKNVQTRVRKILGSSFAEPLSPFIVARDLAAEMADPTERFPVLIELKEEMIGKTLEEKRKNLMEELTRLTSGERDARIDPLRRFVAAELTSIEIDTLAVRHPQLEIARIWKNSEKRALLDKSTHVVQAYTAQLGYGATGRGSTGPFSIRASWQAIRTLRPTTTSPPNGIAPGSALRKRARSPTRAVTAPTSPGSSPARGSASTPPIGGWRRRRSFTSTKSSTTTAGERFVGDQSA